MSTGRSRRFTPINLADVLYVVDRPEWIIGGEEGATKARTEFAEDEVLWALVSPIYYPEVDGTPGISILYNVLNSMMSVHVERCYFPEPKLERLLKKSMLPLFTIESRLPINVFDIVAISIFNTPQCFNILPVLEMAGIPIDRASRVLYKDPLVIGGGIFTINPEPLADFFDVICIGEGEDWVKVITEIYRRARMERWDRRALLDVIASVPGSYVPELTDVEYRDKEGKIARFSSHTNQGRVRRVIADLASQSADLLIPVVHGRAEESDYYETVEVARGCSWSCRFCDVRPFYSPYRERPIEVLKKVIDARIKAGASAIGLSSPNPTAYTHLTEVVDYIISRGAQFCIQTERADTFSDATARANILSGRRWITIALEAPSDRVRGVISKCLSRETFLEACRVAFKNNFSMLKVMAMLCHPTEKLEDLRAGWENLLRDVFQVRSECGKDVSLLISICPFKPKPWTPFQWSKLEMDPAFFDAANIGIEVARRTPEGARSVRVQFVGSNNARWLDTFISRGDRRLALVFRYAHQKGWVFKSLAGGIPSTAMKEVNALCQYHGIPVDKYINGYGVDEDLPWDFIDMGITKAHLRKEWEIAMSEGKDRPPCFERCSDCGACREEFLEGVSHVVKAPPDFKFDYTAFSPHYERMGDVKAYLRFSVYRDPYLTSVTDYRRMIERAILHSDVGTYLRGIMISPAFFEDAMNWEGYAIYEAPVFLKKEMISWSSDQLAKRFQAEFSKYGLGLILNVEVRSKGSLAHELEGAEVTVFLAGLQAEFAKLMAEPHWVVKRAEGFSDSKHWWENDHDQEPEERTNLVDIRNLILNPTQYYASDKLAMTVRKGGSVAEFVSLLTGSSVKDAMRFKPICTRLGLAPLTLS